MPFGTKNVLWKINGKILFKLIKFIYLILRLSAIEYCSSLSNTVVLESSVKSRHFTITSVWRFQSCSADEKLSMICTVPSVLALLWWITCIVAARSQLFCTVTSVWAHCVALTMRTKCSSLGLQWWCYNGFHKLIAAACFWLVLPIVEYQFGNLKNSKDFLF